LAGGGQTRLDRADAAARYTFTQQNHERLFMRPTPGCRASPGLAGRPDLRLVSGDAGRVTPGVVASLTGVVHERQSAARTEQKNAREG
jgi:hypothetical protein